MRRIFLLTFFLLLFFSIFKPKVNAAVIFQDDFTSGNANQWSPVQGPNLWQVAYIDGSNRYGGVVSAYSTIMDTVAGDIARSNYSIDLDMYPVRGVDKNVDFRWVNNSNKYEVHFNSDWGGTAYFGGVPNVPPVRFSLENNRVYHIKVELVNKNIKFFIDGVKLFDINDPNYIFSGHERIGLRIGTGAVAPTEVWFDNIVVTSIDEGIDLPVPPLKQTDPLWGGFTYDSADIWAPSSPAISSWGCALTSAAMIFRYHGITKLPDGVIDLNPGTLNTWLKTQEDGYIRNGLVNWLVLSRLSRLAKPGNSGFLKDALEYRRINGENKSQLLEDLGNNIPGILEEPGHFVVGKGEDNGVFAINDPFYSRTDLSSYGDTFLSLGRYIPSNTDLSYIMLVVNSNVNLFLSDSSNQLVGESFVQNPIDNDEESGTSGNPLKVYYLPVPPDGNYNLNLSATIPTLYNLDIYYYDKDGNAKIEHKLGALGPNDSDDFILNFNKLSSNGSSSLTVISFDTLIKDIKTLYLLREINNKVIYASLLIKAKMSSSTNDFKPISKGILKSILTEVKKQKGKGLSENAYDILSNDIKYLLAS